MVKKILLALFSIFLINQSYGLIENTEHIGKGSIGIIACFAWLLNLFVTGVFAFAGFAFPTENIMMDAYYKIHNPNLLKKWFGWLKVEYFRKFLLATFWRNKDQQKRLFNGKIDGLAHLNQQSKKSEFGHLIPFVLILLIGLFLIFKGHYMYAFLVVLINVIGNLYPVILQRHHRMRIERLRAIQLIRNVPK